MTRTLGSPWRLAHALPCLALALGACGGGDGGDPSGGPATLVFEPGVLQLGLPDSDPELGFFDLPYPSDARTDERGHPVLTGFPQRQRLSLVRSALEVLESERPGFSVVPSIYVRFTGALDEAALPDDPASTTGDASVVTLVDVDPASPRFGERSPVLVGFQAEPTAYWASNTLWVRAIPGVALRPGTRYALAVRTTLRAADGSPVRPSPAFEDLKTGDGDARLAAHYAQVFADLEAQGISRDDLLVAVGFTTADPAAEMDALREAVHAIPVPEVYDWEYDKNEATWISYRGTFDTLEFFSGDPPYTARFGEGLFRFDADGAPVDQVRRPVHINISLPRDLPEPATGYPLILYGHGTGGDDRTHLSGPNDEGAVLARQGFAMVGFEAALHGDRNTSSLDAESLIITNAVAAREMVRQTVADMMLLLRMGEAGALDVPMERAGGDGIHFDTSRVLYMGHSQGAQEAGLLLGVEPTIDAAFLSEAGGGALIPVVERDFNGQPIACAIALIAGAPCAELTEAHPLMTAVIQPLLDPADPLMFAHRYYRERLPGAAPLSMAMTEGTLDTFTPPRAIEAMAAAAGLERVGPEVSDSLGFELAGVETIRAPAQGNLTLGADAVTAGLYQWRNGDHFVIYRNPKATAQYTEFFRTALEGTPVLVGE